MVTTSTSKSTGKVYKPMNELEQQLSDIGVHTLEFVENHPQALTRFCTGQNDLYLRVVENKPQTPKQLLLLGLLTKAHSETLADFMQHAKSRQAMHSVFESELGEEFAERFNDVTLQDLSMVTTLWLFVQGRLNMDFSLANDHAHETAQHLSPFLKMQPDAIRSEFMQSFYQGKVLYQRDNPPRGFWQRIRNLFA